MCASGVEIKINFDENSLIGYSDAQKNIKVYGNYIFLDKEERESLVKRQLDFVITQTQRVEYPLQRVDDNDVDWVVIIHLIFHRLIIQSNPSFLVLVH